MKKIYATVLLFVTSASIGFSQWVDITMPNVNSFTGMTNIGSTLFACSATGVYSTTDEGQSWNTVSNGLPVFSNYTFNSSLINYDGVLYTGTTQSTLYQSNDQGANWTEFHGNFFAGFGSPDHSFFYKSPTVMISAFGESGGLRYSTDNGQSWSTASIWQANGSTGRSIVNVNGTLFAPTITGPIKSMDNGMSWELITGGGLPSINGQGCSLTASAGNLILSVYLSGVYVSTDGGVNWTLKTGSQGESLSAITCIEGNNDVVFIGGPSGYFQSNDHGVSWTSIKDNLITSQVTYSMRLIGSTLFMCDLMGTHKRTVNVQTSSLKEEHTNEFSIYPNPVSAGELNIETELAADIEIVDCVGRKVHSGKLVPGKNKLDILTLTSGSYLARLSTERGTETRSISIK